MQREESTQYYCRRGPNLQCFRVWVRVACTATSRGWCFFVVRHSCFLAVAALASYPGRFGVLVLQQADELGEAVLGRFHVVDGAALQDPALPPRQRLQLEILFDLPADKTECG